MRRIISFILIVCLLQTQSYHATAGIIEEQTGPSVWEKGVSKVAFWRTSDSKKTMDVAQLESGGVNSETKPMITPSELMITLKQHANVLKEQMSAFVNTPMGFTVVFLAGTVLLFYSIYLYITGFSAWLEGIPFDVASKLVTHSSLRTYQLLDVCQNFLGNGKELERTRWYSHYEHASGYNGVPFADALPQWVNNATNLITLLSSAVLAERAVGSSYNQNSNEFATQFKKFLFVNSAQMRRNYSCAFKLGESDHLGEITGCQEDYQKEIYNSVEQNPETSDAMIQFRRFHYKYGFKAPSNLLVRLSINRNHLNTQRYPQVDYSPNPAAIDDVLRVSTQRHLMQLGNQLTLPEAVADRISNNLQAMTQLNDMLSKLRLWESVSHTDNFALTTLVRSIFDANQIALTSDVGCDFDLESGIFKMLSCFQGSARDIPNGAPIPEDAQVWFARTTGNGVNYIQAFANKVPVAEAMATWLKQSTAAMENLWGVADTLHHRVCNGTSDDQIELLRKAAQRELIDHGADLSSDVGCDLRFNDAGIEEILCHAGTAPQLKVAGCDLESNVPVRWEGKLWLQPHALNTEWLDKVIVAASPVWQESRTQMRPYSPSLKISDSEMPTGSGRLSEELTFSGSRSPSNELSQKITQSGTNMGTDSDTSTGSRSPSREMSQRVTGTGSGTDTNSNTGRLSNEMSDDMTSSGSGTTSREMSDELTLSGSGSPSNATMPYSPTLPNANTTGNGITELYYVAPVDNFNGGANVRRAFVNSTHILNDTLFLANTTFGGVWPYSGLSVDTQRQKMYWTTANATNEQQRNIYVADIVSNPMRLNNIRSIYSAASPVVYSVYLSKATGHIFWTTVDGHLFIGHVNITNPTNITNVTDQSMNAPNSQRGFYYDPQTQALLWSKYDSSSTKYCLCKSTLNLQTEQLMNATILLNQSSQILSLSYDVRNRRIIFSSYVSNINAYGLSVAPFNFENPLPLTHITETSSFPPYAISVVND